MLNWDSLIDESALASVLPEEYAHFARPVKDGLTQFLSGLPPERQATILGEQATLPPTTSLSERLGVLAQQCPVLHKLGQVLARDRRLAIELRQQLQKLESLPPSVSLETTQRILADELGPLDQLGVILKPPALAEASVAVVIPFQQTGSPADQPRHGVFKILKPGIQERLEQELTLLEGVGSSLDQRCDQLRIPHLDYEEAFQQVRDKLSEEVRLDHEQRNLVRAQEFYASQADVQIPRLLKHCTNRVTAMERITGGKVTDQHLTGRGEQRRLAQLIVKALIARPIFSGAAEAMFHSDPHAGNLFVTDDKRLAMLDWSLVGVLGENERVAIVQIMLAAVTLQPNRVVQLLEQLDQRQRVDRAALESIVQAWLKRIRYGQFPGLTWLVGMLDEAVQNARLRLATDLMLFRKTLHTLEGVLAEIGADGADADEVLFTEFLRQFSIEWPLRWIAPPTSRSFPTRLSNLDLTQTVLNLPLTGARFWASQTLDMIQVARSKLANGDSSGSGAGVQPAVQTCPTTHEVSVQGK